MMRSWCRSLLISTLAISLSGCSLLGLGLGGAYAQSQNSDPRVERGERSRTSVGKSMAIGAGVGLVIDAALLSLAVVSAGGST
jgi:hypothetical protein